MTDWRDTHWLVFHTTPYLYVERCEDPILVRAASGPEACEVAAEATRRPGRYAAIPATVAAFEAAELATEAER